MGEDLRGRADVVRHYVGEQSYETETIATADDFSTSNGIDVLDWQQAQEEARRRRDTRVRTATGKGPFTVADSLALYLKALAEEGRKRKRWPNGRATVAVAPETQRLRSCNRPPTFRPSTCYLLRAPGLRPAAPRRLAP